MAALFALMWWLSLRRVALAGRLVETSGTLHEIKTEKRDGPRGTTYWVARGRYDYLVGGKPFKGTRVGLEFNSFATEAKALAVICDRRAGQPVTVRYDPETPRIAVLNKTPPAKIGLYRVLCVIALAFVVAGAIAALLTMSAGLPAAG
jgi:hypothetical protein